MDLSIYHFTQIGKAVWMRGRSKDSREVEAEAERADRDAGLDAVALSETLPVVKDAVGASGCSCAFAP